MNINKYLEELIEDNLSKKIVVSYSEVQLYMFDC